MASPRRPRGCAGCRGRVQSRRTRTRGVRGWVFSGQPAYVSSLNCKELRKRRLQDRGPRPIFMSVSGIHSRNIFKAQRELPRMTKPFPSVCANVPARLCPGQNLEFRSTGSSRAKSCHCPPDWMYPRHRHALNPDALDVTPTSVSFSRNPLPS